MTGTQALVKKLLAGLGRTPARRPVSVPVPLSEIEARHARLNAQRKTKSCCI